MRFRLGLAGFLAAAFLHANTYTVTNTNDSGAGSLRQAILDANANPGADTIVFAIPGAGVHTIVLTTWLPNATDSVTVDGYTQPGSSPNTLPLAQGTNAVLNVEIDGAARHAGAVLVLSGRRRTHPGRRDQPLSRRRGLRHRLGRRHREFSRHVAGRDADQRIDAGVRSHGPRHARRRSHR